MRPLDRSPRTLPWRPRGRASGRAPLAGGAALLAGGALLLAGAGAPAQTVSLGGSLGSKALLIIDGAPRSVAVGATVEGVRLLSVTGGEAVVEVKGRRVPLALGDAQLNLGGATDSDAAAGQIVLTATSGGHFFSAGSIEGKAVRFLVDTGATQVAIGQSEADRIGLAYRSAPRGWTNTANGQVPIWKVSLGVVRVGEVQLYNVDAVVLPASMPYVLLGNSFLTRFQMKRENDTLTLARRY